jgi:hypothetical protein
MCIDVRNRIGSELERCTVEPSYKDVLPTSNLIRTIEPFYANLGARKYLASDGSFLGTEAYLDECFKCSD